MRTKHFTPLEMQFLTGFIVSSLAIALAAGCANMDKMLALKSLGNSQKQMQGYVKKQDALFKKLVRNLTKGRLKPRTLKSRIVTTYGEPIIEFKNYHNADEEVFLYRYARDYFNSDKVYLYFNKSEELIRWEHKPRKENNL
jgi:hypothetical protein